ncbi:hypothetical protein P167DRAFT_565538 [Morchella conica CCBAS932]|uniref:BTB domain-containing protein n=1 Tax=Morchella conica CCBAS932 TaxID=1392247 RepID=A0A3N4KNC0_9PEZI|nr:hypothetical protein P167DRAFT_565538 [Morchella conica CCBAS932]
MSHAECNGRQDAQPVGGAIARQYRFYYGVDYDGDGNPSLQITSGEHDLGPVPPSREIQEKHCAAFRTLFAFFYRQHSPLTTLPECTAVVALAASLEALDSIADSIRARLLEWPHIDAQIREAPTAYLVLGYRVKSVRVFREAFIHVVGKLCGRHEGLMRWCKDRSVPESVVALVKAECSRLTAVSMTAVKSLQCIGSGGAAGERESDHYKVAVAVLRERLASCLELHGGEGSEGALFRMIVNCRFDISAYDVERYSTRANVDAVVNSSARIVERIREIARRLVKNNLRRGEEMAYLTCAELADDEVPWVTCSQ